MKIQIEIHKKKCKSRSKKFGIKVVSLGDNEAKSNLKSLALSIIYQNL